MALKLSTNLRTALLSGDELRRIFEDAIINVYSGAAPATADLAPTGTLLVSITKASGTVSSGEISTAQEALVSVDTHASGETFILVLNGTSYTYTNTPDLDAIPVAAAIAAMINASGQPVIASHAGTVNIYIRSKIRGLAFTLTKGAGTGTMTTFTEAAVANAISDAVRFGAASDGAIAKDAAVWSGVAIAAGTAGYFRIVNSADDHSLDSSTKLYPRLQGTVGTSGTDMVLTNTTIAIGSTQTIDTAVITMPAS